MLRTTKIKICNLEGGESQSRALREVAREEGVVGRQLQIVGVHLKGQLITQIENNDSQLM